MKLRIGGGRVKLFVVSFLMRVSTLLTGMFRLVRTVNTYGQSK